MGNQIPEGKGFGGCGVHRGICKPNYFQTFDFSNDVSTQASNIIQNFVESGTLFRQLFLKKKVKRHQIVEKINIQKLLDFIKRTCFQPHPRVFLISIKCKLFLKPVLSEENMCRDLKIGTRLQNLDVFHKLQMYLCLFVVLKLPTKNVVSIFAHETILEDSITS